MPQPDTFADLIEQVEAAFPDRLPAPPSSLAHDPNYIAALHWRAAGARAVVAFMQSLFVDPAENAVDPNEDEES